MYGHAPIASRRRKFVLPKIFPEVLSLANAGSKVDCILHTVRGMALRHQPFRCSWPALDTSSRGLGRPRYRRQRPSSRPRWGGRGSDRAHSTRRGCHGMLGRLAPEERRSRSPGSRHAPQEALETVTFLGDRVLLCEVEPTITPNGTGDVISNYQP